MTGIQTPQFTSWMEFPEEPELEKRLREEQEKLDRIKAITACLRRKLMEKHEAQ